MKYLSLIFLIILFGCGEVDKSELKKLNGIEDKKSTFEVKGNPFEVKKEEKVLQNTKNIKEAETKAASEIEKMKLKQIAQDKRFEVELKKENIKNEMELKKLERKQKLLEVEKQYEMYKILAIIFGVILLLVVLFFYLYKRKKVHTHIEAEKEKFHREKDIELYKLQTQRFEKIVEVVKNKELSKESEKAILDVIHQESSTNIIEVEPKKKGLFYKK